MEIAVHVMDAAVSSDGQYKKQIYGSRKFDCSKGGLKERPPLFLLGQGPVFIVKFFVFRKTEL